MSATGRSIERETEGQRWSQERALLAAAAIIFGGALAAGILAADAPLLVVVGASVLFLGIAMVLRPDVATLTGIGLIYSNAAVVLVRFHGAPGFVAAMVPLLLVVPLARDLVVRRLPVVAPQPLRWMLVLFGIYLVSALFSADTSRSWDEVVVFITEGLLLYFLVINVVRSPGMIRGVTWVLLAGGGLVSIAVVHQAITGNYDSNYFGFAQADALIRTGVTTLTGDVLVPRMAGSIGETNRFAQTMLMLVPLGIFRAIDERSAFLRVVAGLLTLLITLAVVLSFSRGAAVGLAALVLALLFLRMIRLQYVIAMLVVLVAILVAFPQYTNRITSLAGVGGLDSSGTSAVDKLRKVVAWTMGLKLAGEMPSLPSQNSSLRTALIANKDYMDGLMDVSDRLGAWIEAAQAQGALNPKLPSIAVLYTLYARACDPVLEFLKMGGLYTNDEIVALVLSTCFEGLETR